MEKIIKLAKDNWMVIINEKEAKDILKEYPNILESYYIQNKVFKGIRPYDVLYKDIED